MLHYVKLCQVNSNANGLILEQVLKILSLIGLSMKKKKMITKEENW